MHIRGLLFLHGQSSYGYDALLVLTRAPIESNRIELFKKLDSHEFVQYSSNYELFCNFNHVCHPRLFKKGPYYLSHHTQSFQIHPITRHCIPLPLILYPHNHYMKYSITHDLLLREAFTSHDMHSCDQATAVFNRP
jgi:hypothetical protein